jgi:hypothetical protein
LYQTEKDAHLEFNILIIIILMPLLFKFQY